MSSVEKSLRNRVEELESSLMVADAAMATAEYNYRNRYQAMGYHLSAVVSARNIVRDVLKKTEY